MRPKDMPSADAFEHGTRSRYTEGCRCDACRESNNIAYHKKEAIAKAAALELGPKTETHCVGIRGNPCPYETKLRSDSTGNLCMRCRKALVWNGLVSATPARVHMRKLSRRGIGTKSVQYATDISRSVLHKVARGEQKKIRAHTEALILAVDESAASDGCLVDAKPVWRMVSRLISIHGYTKGEISKRIGKNGVALQLGKKRMTARNAMKIRKLLMDAEGDFLRSRE